jgi:hypothetical protein
VRTDGDGIARRREPALLCALDAQKADEIRSIRVIWKLDAADLVAAGGVVRRGFALVRDVTEEVSALVLRPRPPEVHADAPIEERGVLSVVAITR